MHLPEDGHMSSGRNMYEVYGVYNLLLYTHCALFGFDISWLIARTWINKNGDESSGLVFCEIA
jgi:hypothetical protein